MTKTYLPLSLIVLFMSACGPGKQSSEDQQTDTTAVDTAKYSLYKAPDSYEYPEAALTMISPETDLDTGSTDFKFEVSNYELGVQTPDADQRGIANSGKGQHIHFILNNDPYSAHYTPEFSKNLKEGKHIVLAFLSRSYHESVKNDSAFVLKELNVGDVTGEASFDFSGQHLFYSRPKGTYSGKDTDKLLLDFFLYNVSLSESGNKVRATINGEEFMITEWAPYYIEGLEKGEVTVKLELLDSTGSLIPGPYNSVERTVTLE